MTSRVSRVDTKIPKISDTAKPLKIGSSRMKRAPSVADRAVSKIGCARVMAEFTTASFKSIPLATCRLIKSTNKIELRTMIPASAIIPIIDVAVNCAPSKAWPGITPIIVSGIGAMMTSGVR